MRCQFLLFLALLFAPFLSPVKARAELPEPRFLYLAPLGAAAGSDIEVTVRGADFETIDTLMFDQPGFQAKLIGKPTPAAAVFMVSIAPDVPEGTYDVWALGKFGISNPRLFAVSRGLKEVAKKGHVNDPKLAQTAEINSVINATTDAEGDYYRFEAKKGQRLTFDCFAQRLLILENRGVAAAPEMSLTVLSDDGRTLASNSHYYGNDPFLDYVFSQDGNYSLQVEELKYLSGALYRLIISDRPHIENVFPRAIEPGKPTEVTVLGQNLGPGSTRSTWQIGGQALEEKRMTVTLAADPAKLAQFSFMEHPTGLSFPMTCSTVGLRGTQIRPDCSGGTLNAVNVLYATTTPINEVEPNDSREQAQKLPLPALVNARFDKPGDVDWFSVNVPEGKGGKYTLQVYCERLGGRADPYVVVQDEKGSQVAELDDSGFSQGNTDGRNRDPIGAVDLQAKRSYRIMVKDLHGRGGARCQYVLSLRLAEPDFYCMATSPIITLGGVGHCPGTTIRRGGAAAVVVSAFREGLPFPVTITATGLPPGLHAAPCILPATSGNNPGEVILWADADAPEWAGEVHLIGTAQVDGKTLIRPVTPCTFASDVGGGRQARSFMVAIRHSSPFSLHVTADKAAVPAGGKVELKAIADRHWPQFKAKITVQPNKLAYSPVPLSAFLIPDQHSDAASTLQIPATTPPGEYTLFFDGVSTVPFQNDAKEKGKVEEVTLYEPSRPVTLIVTRAGEP